MKKPINLTLLKMILKKKKNELRDKEKLLNKRNSDKEEIKNEEERLRMSLQKKKNLKIANF